MGIFQHIHKHIVAAFASIFLLAVPLAAQETDLDELFEALRDAPAGQAEEIAEQISARWEKSGSAAMDLLLKRGMDALDGDDLDAAIEHLTALIDHAPDFAQAYHGRAMAYFRAEYFGPALADINRALSLNPRHFRAMTGLAVILEESGEVEKALAAYRAVLALHPHKTDVLEAVERLLEQVEGVTL